MKTNKGSKTLRLEGLIPLLEEDQQAYESLDRRAMAYLAQIGLKLPEQPMKDGKPLVPSIPKGPNGPSLTGLDERGLSDLYAQLLAHFGYASAQLGVLEIQKAALLEKLDITESKIQLLLDPPESTKKVRVKADKRVQELNHQLTEVKAKIVLVEKIVNGVQEEMKLVSREVTIRQSERDGIDRQDNMGRRRTGGIPGGRRRG